MLYKYASESGIPRILRDQKLAFTSIAELNDPFEGGIDMSELEEEQWGRFDEFALRAISEHTGLPANSDSVAAFKALLAKKGISEDHMRDVNKMTAWHSMVQKFRGVGILSLTTKPDDILMWAHYSDEFKGLVIGFDEKSIPFSNSELCRIKGPHPVNYATNRANASGASLEDRVRAICLTKSSCWQYESEVRCLRHVPPGQPRVTAHVPTEAVLEIILGPRMPRKVMEQIRDLLSKFARAKLKLAVPSPSKFRLEIKPLPPAGISDLMLEPASSIDAIDFTTL